MVCDQLKRRRFLILPAIAAALLSGGLAKRAQAGSGDQIEFSVKDYGATGDGKTLDTDAINKTIDAAVAKGGGLVVFPAGKYLSFSIHLKSNVTLRLDAGATLTAAEPGPLGSYDAPEPNLGAGKFQDFSHMHWHNSLIWAENQTNIGITGTGHIDGAGLIKSSRRADPRGNKSIGLRECKNVTISGVTVTHGGHFAILTSGCQDLTIDGITIDTNRDGLDIDCCQRVNITRCVINAPNDDGIALKSSYSLAKVMQEQDVTITDCHLTGYDEGTLIDKTQQRKADYGTDEGPTSRIKLGTETTSGYKNITISRCSFVNTRGLALEAVDGASMENVTIDHITMQDVTDSPLFLRLGTRFKRPNLGPPDVTMKKIAISDITATNVNPRYPAVIAGVPNHPIQDVTLTNINLQYVGGGAAVPPATQPVVNYSLYPEPEIFASAPAYGLYAQFVDGLRIKGLKITYAKVDKRPPIVMESVTNSVTSDIDAQHADGVPAFVASPASQPAAK